MCVTKDHTEKFSISLNRNPVLSSFLTYHRVCNKTNTLGATCGAGTAHSSMTPELIHPCFLVGCSIFIFE